MVLKLVTVLVAGVVICDVVNFVGVKSFVVGVRLKRVFKSVPMRGIVVFLAPILALVRAFCGLRVVKLANPMRGVVWVKEVLDVLKTLFPMVWVGVVIRLKGTSVNCVLGTLPKYTCPLVPNPPGEGKFFMLTPAVSIVPL